MKNFVKVYPDKAYPIAWHTRASPLNVDDLALDVAGYFWKAMDAAPNWAMFINRGEEGQIKHIKSGGSKAKWENEAQFDKPAIAGISIKHSWNKNNRTIKGTLFVEFASKPSSDDLGVGLFIQEDSIIGGPRYDHYTDYNFPDYPEIDKWGEYMDQDANHFAAGYWIPQYPHRWAFREAVFEGEYFGKTGDIPNNPDIGTVYEIPFTHTLPTEYHGLDVVDNRVYLLVFVSYHEAKVINVERVNLVGDATEIKAVKGNKVKSLKQKTGVSVGTDNLRLNIKSEGNYSFDLYSVDGCQLMNVGEKMYTRGVYTIPLTTGTVAGGVYFVKVHCGSDVGVVKCVRVE